MINQSAIIDTIRTVNDAARDYAQIIEDTQFAPVLRKLMFKGLTFEAAKRLTDNRRAEKVREAEVNDANTIGAVCLNVHGWYVRVTVCLVTQTLLSVDDERKPSMQRAS
jgi:hypothetical protein